MTRRNRPAWLKGGWGRKFRRSLAERYGWACFYCRRRFPTRESVTADHFIPVALLPIYPKENIVPACFGCNNRKGDLLPRGLVLVLLSGDVKADIAGHPGIREAA